MNGITQFITEDSDEAVEKFLHAVVDELRGDNVLWSRRFPEAKSLDIVKKACVSFFSKVVGESLTKDEVVALLQSGKYLSGEALKRTGMAVIQVWASRKEEIHKALLNGASNDFGESYLQDFDWKVQLTLSSSKISTLRDPLLLLNLSLASNNNKPLQQILFELPKDSVCKWDK